MIVVLFIFALAFNGNLCKNRVLHGYPAIIDDWSSMATLLTRSDTAPSWDLRCGAVIITKFHVLTSAWCLKIVLEKEIASKTIIIRSNTEYWNCDCGRKRDHVVIKYIVHEKFIEPTPFKPSPFYEHDLGILMVQEPFQGLYEIPKPFNHADRYWHSGATDGIAIGYGFGKNDRIQNQLHSVKIQNYGSEYCKTTYGKALPRSTFCAGFHTKPKASFAGPCEYDTGGPYFGILENQTILIGIVSTGKGCGKKPAVFTNISCYTAWITSKFGKSEGNASGYLPVYEK